jgi:hypothetical protein
MSLDSHRLHSRWERLPSQKKAVINYSDNNQTRRGKSVAVPLFLNLSRRRLRAVYFSVVFPPVAALLFRATFSRAKLKAEMVAADRARVVFDCRMANDPATINKESTNENNTDVDHWVDARRLRINGKPCT